jgi:hypothetical protein
MLYSPFLRAYSWFAPEFTGVILFLRVLYAAMAILTAFAIRPLLRRLLSPVPATILALVPIVFIPFGLPAPSYNSIGMLGMLSALCLFADHLADVWATPDETPDRRRVPTAAALFALTAVAYPTSLGVAVAFFGLAVLLAPSWKACRPLLPLLAYGAVFLTLGAAIVLAVFGLPKLQAMMAFEREARPYVSGTHPLEVGWKYFTSQPAFPAFCALGFAVTMLAVLMPRPWTRAAHAAVLIGLFVGVMRLRTPCFHNPGHDIIFLLAVSALPILLDLRHGTALAPWKRVLLALYGTGLVGGVMTSWTASHSLYNFPIGGLLAVIAALTYLAACEERWWHAALPAGAAVTLAVCSTITVYGHGVGRLAELKYRVRSGPFAGLRTTWPQYEAIVRASEQLARCEGRCRSVLVITPYAGLYLMTPLKPCTPFSFFHASTEAVWRRAEAMAAGPDGLPDLIVDWPALRPKPLRPEQVRFLESRYRKEDEEGPLHLYVRKDLTPPAPHFEAKRGEHSKARP